MGEGDLVLYRTEDGKTELFLRELGGTVWLTQRDIAELFETSIPNINMHIKGILEDGELSEATIKYNLMVRVEGDRDVQREVAHYSLPMILAIGYRVRSRRGVQFRQWATSTLQEYLTKGFVMDSDRLKDPAGVDYFDELLEKIRDIRASEKRFYQKIKDVYATAVDYEPNTEAAQLFFSKVQNKLLHAVAGKTAAELIIARADAGKPNMGLTSWKGGKVRKGDVTVAKNYLDDGEVSELNRITTMYLDFAEDQARRRKAMSMADWSSKLDAFLAFNDRDVLEGAGSRSRAQMVDHTSGQYTLFDAKRKEVEKQQADAEYLEDLKVIEDEVKALQRLSKK